jgi:HEAT repeat protein
MPVLPESAIHAVYVAALITFLFTLALIFFALIRRSTHHSFYRRLDLLRRECRSVLEGMLTGAIAYESGLAALKAHCNSHRAAMLERVLVEAKPTERQAPTLRRICEDLGFVRAWQEQLAAAVPSRSKVRALILRSSWRTPWRWPDFPDRAKAAEYLGAVRHGPSWRLMVRALNDPHADVRTAAVRALGVIGEPRSFAFLVKELGDAARPEELRFSIATLRSALSRFPLRLAPGVRSLSLSPDARARFLAAQVIQEMTRRTATMAGLRELAADAYPVTLLDDVLELSHDDDPNVRARAAIILGYVEDPNARRRVAALLQDGEWFVRLQAVKAVERCGVQALERQIAARLADSNWRVREAAANVLQRHSQSGADLLLSRFLESSDAYMKDQIAEELQRSGLISAWLAHAGESDFERETQALSQLVEMGKTGLLEDALARPMSEARRAKLAAILKLQEHPTEHQAVGP